MTLENIKEMWTNEQIEQLKHFYGQTDDVNHKAVITQYSEDFFIYP